MNKDLRIPEVLPILPLKKTVVYPSMIGLLEIEQEPALRLLDDIKEGDRLLVVVAQKDSEREPIRLDDLFRVGTVVRLAQMERNPDGKLQIGVLGLERATIGELTQEQPYFVGRIAFKPDIQEAQDETEAVLRQVIPSFQQLVALSQKMPEHVVSLRLDTKEPREVLYTMAFFAGMDLEHAQQLLEFDPVSAKIHSLSNYLTTELEKFEQSRQAVYESGQLQSKSQHDTLATALDAFNAADTWDETLRVLEAKQQMLLSEDALDALRSRLASLREQKASSHWIFRLEHDLEFLEDAHQHGIDLARQHLEQRLRMLQNQQEVFEAFKKLATVNTPEDILNLVTEQQADPFSPDVFSVLGTLFDQVAEQDPAQKERLQTMLRILEESGQYGAEAAMERLVERTRPGFKQEFERAEEVLEEYLTSTTLGEAYQTLKVNEDVLLSDLAHDMLQHYIAQLYKVGDNRSAEKLEMHLYLLEDARIRGIDPAWQTFIADSDEEDEDIDEEDIE